jgi:hypothetical protein
VEREYVGIDLHRRRSVIVRKNADGELLSKTRIVNDPAEMMRAVGEAGPEPEVVLEATFGWYWAADLLQEMGAHVHLAHPLGNDWGNRRVKTDERDANDLVDLLRLGRLAEAWVAPTEVRELRELVRYRAKLVRLRSGLRPRCTPSWASTACPRRASTCSAQAGPPSSTLSSSPTPTPGGSRRCASWCAPTTPRWTGWTARSPSSWRTAAGSRPSR